MATALIIHAPDDALPARALAEKLRSAKLTVVLEKAAGEETREAAKGTQVIVALWSPRSVTQQTLVDDVAAVRGKTKVVHAQMQNAQTPSQFGSDKSVNLTGWRGEDEFAPWRELANAITERAGVAPIPPPAPRPPSGFFTPGRQDGVQAAPAQAAAGAAAPKPAAAPRAAAPRQAPPPRQAAAPPRQAAAPPRQAAPRPVQPPPGYEPDEPKKGGMGMILGIVALVVVLGGGAAGYMWWQGQQATHASAAAFDQIDRNDPGALRAFIAATSGPAKAQAQGALSELEERSYEAASDADTIDSLQGFLRDFPNSQHALAARGRIAELQANPADTGTDTTTMTGVDQPTTTDLVAPGGATTTTTPAPGGAPVQLTPPSEPSTSTEPPSAPATTTP